MCRRIRSHLAQLPERRAPHEPEGGSVPFRELAQRNISDLAIVENEIFAWRTSKGNIVPVHAKYWDLQPDGTAPVFLRLE